MGSEGLHKIRIAGLCTTDTGSITADRPVITIIPAPERAVGIGDRPLTAYSIETLFLTDIRGKNSVSIE